MKRIASNNMLENHVTEQNVLSVYFYLKNLERLMWSLKSFALLPTILVNYM